MATSTSPRGTKRRSRRGERIGKAPDVEQAATDPDGIQMTTLRGRREDVFLGQLLAMQEGQAFNAYLMRLVQEDAARKGVSLGSLRQALSHQQQRGSYSLTTLAAAILPRKPEAKSKSRLANPSDIARRPTAPSRPQVAA
ncbi:hypothetical protein AB0J43_07460 [Nonomuraea fuscirosea]